jgi:hypothetical protein
MREPRTAVMILVEASWEDQGGALQTVRACMENKSAGGACIRIKTRIGVGSNLWIQSRWEEFSGVAKYCRSEGRDYLLGIQRDTRKRPIPNRAVPADVPRRELMRSGGAQVATAKIESVPKQQESKPSEITVEERKMESVAIVPKASFATATAPRGVGQETDTWESASIPQHEDFEALRLPELQTKQAPKGEEAGKEREHMRRKWFELVHRGNKQGGLNGNGNEKSNGKGETGNRAHEAVALLEKSPEDTAGEGVASLQDGLLSMEDIYRAAGIMNPRRGYSITKVVEMLHSEHIRGLSKEMRRAAVLMALDAAGIAIDEVLQDAKVRQEAMNSYEAEQRKQIEELWARKAEENIQIQAELERVKAHYMERIKRNLDGVEREKVTFGTWLTMKQQESQSISEAVELCLKPTVSESASASLPPDTPKVLAR